MTPPPVTPTPAEATAIRDTVRAYLDATADLEARKKRIAKMGENFKALSKRCADLGEAIAKLAPSASYGVMGEAARDRARRLLEGESVAGMPSLEDLKRDLVVATADRDAANEVRVEFVQAAREVEETIIFDTKPAMLRALAAPHLRHAANVLATLRPTLSLIASLPQRHGFGGQHLNFPGFKPSGDAYEISTRAFAGGVMTPALDVNQAAANAWIDAQIAAVTHPESNAAEAAE